MEVVRRGAGPEELETRDPSRTGGSRPGIRSRQARTLLCLALFLAGACRAPGAGSSGPRLAHDVYFTLREDTSAARTALRAACHGLERLDGVLELSTGERVADLERPVNDQTFDVSLHVLFADRAAHDRYQVAPKHRILLAEWGPRFESVRVFDSWAD